MIRQLGTFLLAIGFDPRRLLASTKFVPVFAKQAVETYSKSRKQGDFQFAWLPVLSDRYHQSGVAKGHYFHQDLWAARAIYSRAPSVHIDVGSRVDGFVAHLLSFREVHVIDVRPLASNVPGLKFLQADLMKEAITLPKADSVSCLHALEHFGLGRYGDPLDVNGWRKGVKNLAAMLTEGGILYVSVPVGSSQRIEFNAHRVFHPRTIVEEFKNNGCELVEFSAVDDSGDFVTQADLEHCSYQFGCGCFVFQKRTVTQE